MELTPGQIIILFLIGFYILWRLLKEKALKLRKKPVRKKRLFLSKKIKARAERKFKKLTNKFKQKHKRKPIHKELFRIVIKASHLTVRRKDKRGHWIRQRIRKYLLEKHKIVKKYRMK